MKTLNHMTTLCERFLLSILAVVSIIVLVWLLRFCQYGFDTTDESLYLVWIATPFHYTFSITQFGFIYHPFYTLLHGNIAGLRQLNVIFTFVLSWLLCYFYLESLFGKENLKKLQKLILAASVATSSLVLFDSWLTTPSYNSLALQASIIVAIGMLLSENNYTFSSISGWILIGVGGWLAFMAKPTTAAGLGLCITCYLLFSGKFSYGHLAITLFNTILLLILSSLLIDHSILGFINRLNDGLTISSILTSDNIIYHSFRIDDVPLDSRSKIFLVFLTIFFFTLICLKETNFTLTLYLSYFLVAFLPVTALLIMLGFTRHTFGIGNNQGVLLWSIPFASLLACLSLGKIKVLYKISRSIKLYTACFLVFPHINAFGTGSNYWATGSSAGLFWVLASMSFVIAYVKPNKLLFSLIPICFSVQWISVTLLQTAVETPYRQSQSLRLNNKSVTIGDANSPLILSEENGNYFSKVISLTKQAGFKKETPMIDLSGQSPGVLYSIGATNVGHAWILGGYPNSDHFAEAGLNRESCENLARAWLLFEPEGPRKISALILSSFGANISQDFEIIGTMKTALGMGGYREPRVQQILKPIRQMKAAISSCEELRKLKTP